MPRVCLDSPGVYHGCGQMDHGGKTLIGLVGAHGDAFEFLQLTEEVLDEVAPCLHLLHIDGERGFARRGCCEMTTLAPRVELGDNGVAVERLVSDQRVEGTIPSMSGGIDRVEALSRQKHEATRDCPAHR